MTAAPGATAGAQELLGGPVECSQADFELALAGEYTGPPCRFVQRPDSPAPQLPERPQIERSTAARPLAERMPAQTQQARPAMSAQHVPSRSQVRPAATPVFEPRRPAPRNSRVYQADSTQSFTHQRQSISTGDARSRTSRVYQAGSRGSVAEHAETVTLGDEFFQGSLTGGVERPGAPLYNYRGLILIDASGRTSYGHNTLPHRPRVTRAMDATGYQPPRASYPPRPRPHN
jgi:hypothetical protein